MNTSISNNGLGPNEKNPVDVVYEIVDKYVSLLESSIKREVDKETLLNMLMEFYQTFDENMTEVKIIYEYLQNEK